MVAMDFVKLVYEKLDFEDMVISFFLDFSKAFDCLDRSIFMSKLIQYWVRSIPKDWFKTYIPF